jgi:hypothetical protein
MSWANRAIPRKRDISQIPEEARPNIIPRFQRPLVVQSEQAQQYHQNVIITPLYMNGKTSEPGVNPRIYPVKKIDDTRGATELTLDGKTFVFVILRNIQVTRDNDLWITSYNSIRKYYSNKIIIIDDNSTINTVNGKLINTETIKSEINGAGEILPYFYFNQYKWADYMIFLHDSMFLNRMFTEEELQKPISFHWYFNTKGVVDMKRISTFISLLENNEGLMEYTVNPMSQWKGCFGGTTIIHKDVIEQLEDKYGLFSKLALTIRTRKDRETFERVFGLIVFYENLVSDDCANFGDIMKYPGAFETYNNTSIQSLSDTLASHSRDYALIKVWRGR